MTHIILSDQEGALMSSVGLRSRQGVGRVNIMSVSPTCQAHGHVSLNDQWQVILKTQLNVRTRLHFTDALKDSVSGQVTVAARVPGLSTQEVL